MLFKRTNKQTQDMEKIRGVNIATETENVHIKKEMELSLKAGEIVGLIYSAFAKEYKDLTKKHDKS